jgi:hypothetical protein
MPHAREPSDPRVKLHFNQRAAAKLESSKFDPREAKQEKYFQSDTLNQEGFLLSFELIRIRENRTRDLIFLIDISTMLQEKRRNCKVTTSTSKMKRSALILPPKTFK